MDRATELIIGWFPRLKDDENFKITSPYNPCYNCISWAQGISGKWNWPNTPEERDGFMTWENSIGYADDIDTFIRYYETQGFRLCKEEELEEGSVVLYAIGNSCKHAARKLQNGLWTSKLGPWHDIQHATPHSLEGDMYGKVYCYMKK